MNFNQWRNYISKGTVPKIVYCCGDQTALVELVVEDIKNTLQVPVTDFNELDARTDQSVWEHASTYPLDPKSTRLTIVRHAEYVNNWQQLIEWLAHTKKNTKNYILFISYQPDAPYVYNKGKKDGYVEHIEVIRNKGKLVRCSQPNDDDLISWAKSYGLTQAAANHLVERTSGDSSAMLSVLKKVHVWSGSPSNNALDLLCEEKALDSFADYLILRDKTNAYLALQSMTDEQKSKIISHLDYRLDTVMEIARCLRKRMYATDIAATTGIKVFLVKRFIPAAKEYDDKKIRHCRQLLAMVDSTQNQGAKVGTWEILISLW